MSRDSTRHWILVTGASADLESREKEAALQIGTMLAREGYGLVVGDLSGWQERPVQGLTERQFLELVRPWRYDTRTIARLLRASLATGPDIFISYRREDVPAAAGRIFDELSHAYGERSVFIDYANLLVGQEVDRILDRLRECKVVIAIAGPSWERDRLGNPDDYVRREIEAARAARINVIPLLVSRSSLPPRSELPESLAFLWDLSFARLHTEDWSGSVRRLEAAVDDAIFATDDG